MQDAKGQPPATTAVSNAASDAVPDAIPAARRAGTGPQATSALAFVIPDTVQRANTAPACENGVCAIPVAPAKRD